MSGRPVNRSSTKPAEAVDEVETVVRVLLGQAGLTVPDEEVARLARLYPGLRRSADRLAALPVGDEVPAAVFHADPTEGGRP